MKPWLQHPDETGKAYAAFEAYLEERDRSTREAYLAYLEWRDGTDADQERAGIDRAPGYFRAWKSEHEWDRRRKAFYRQVDEEAYDRLMDSKKRRKVERIEALDGALDALTEHGLDLLASRLNNRAADVQDITILLDKLMRHYREELDDLPTQEHDVANADEIAAMLGLDLTGGDGD